MFSHTHSPDGLNGTLLFQGCVLETTPSVGMVGGRYIPWTGEGVKHLWLPGSSPGQLADMPAQWLPPTAWHILYFTELISDSEFTGIGLVAKLCPTLVTPWDCNTPGSSVHGIIQARILEWVAIPFSRGSSWPRDRTHVSCITGQYFTEWTTREASLE